MKSLNKKTVGFGIFVFLAMVLLVVYRLSIPIEPRKNKLENTRLRLSEIARDLRLYRKTCNSWPESIRQMYEYPCEKLGWHSSLEPLDQWGRSFNLRLEGNDAVVFSNGGDSQPGDKALEERVTK